MNFYRDKTIRYNVLFSKLYFPCPSLQNNLSIQPENKLQNWDIKFNPIHFREGALYAHPVVVFCPLLKNPILNIFDFSHLFVADAPWVSLAHVFNIKGHSQRKRYKHCASFTCFCVSKIKCICEWLSKLLIKEIEKVLNSYWLYWDQQPESILYAIDNRYK